MEARAAILRSLISAFQGAWNRIRYQEDDFEDDAERLLNARDIPKMPEVNMKVANGFALAFRGDKLLSNRPPTLRLL